ncbi:MAG: hypothetical protein IT446_04055 [Phycisphaerales bacterium]|nr:hypothetical protein [Phycisphaerales bacterium]
MSKFTPEEILRRKRMLLLIVAGAIVLLLWGMYLSESSLGFDLLHPRTKPDANSIRTSLFLAIIGTIVGAVVAYTSYRRMGVLLKHGVWTEARIVKISSLGNHGMTPTTLAFMVDGREYIIHRDLPAEDLRSMDRSTRIPIIYNPKNPKQCDWMIDKRPTEPDKSSIMEFLREILAYPMVVVLYTANAAILIGLMRAMGGDLTVWMIPILIACIGLVLLEGELLSRRFKQVNTDFFPRFRWKAAGIFIACAVLLAGFMVWSHQRDRERQRQIDAGQEQWDQQVRQLKQRATAMPR